MIVTELSKGTKLYLLVGGKGERLASVTDGYPKPLVNINDKSLLRKNKEFWKFLRRNFLVSFHNF